MTGSPASAALRQRAAAARERVRRGHREHERLFEERQRLEIVALDRQREQQQLELARPQAGDDALRLILAQQQLELGVGGAHRRQRARQQIWRDGWDHAEREPAGEGALRHARLVEQVVDAAQRLARALDHARSGGRHEHLAPVALEQPQAQQLLELADLERERRLRDRAGLRRAPEVEGVGERDQVLELTDRRPHDQSSLSLLRTRSHHLVAHASDPARRQAGEQSPGCAETPNTSVMSSAGIR